MKKPLPPTYFLAALLLIAALHFLLPAAILLTFPWTLVGCLPLVSGVALTLLTDQALKKHHTTVKPFEKSDALVTGGVFRLSRNPMYLGMTLLLLGVALLFGSLGPLAVVVLFAVSMDVLFIRPEQRMLEAQFGPDWQAYRRRVRRWI